MDEYEITLFNLLKYQSEPEPGNQLDMEEKIQILSKVLEALIYIQRSVVFKDNQDFVHSPLNAVFMHLRAIYLI